MPRIHKRRGATPPTPLSFCGRVAHNSFDGLDRLSSYCRYRLVLPSLHRLPARVRAGALGAMVCSILACAILAAVPAEAQIKTASRMVSRTALEHAAPAGAQIRTGSRAVSRAASAHAAKQPFGDIPKGPLQIFISVNQQKLHLYSNGVEVAETLVATGVPQHPTPLGVFNIVQKQLYHRSNIYSGAPMPFMERLTWSGVALHEGVNLGHPASHGCIRMSHDFAVRLYEVSKLGVEVFIADPELRPREFADPHLFVHKDPVPVVPVLAAASIAALPAALAQNAPASDAGAADAANEKVVANSERLADPPNGDTAATDGAGAADADNVNKITADDAAADPAHHNKAAADDSLLHDAADPPPPAPAAHSVTADLETAPPPPLPRVAPAPLRASKTPIAIFISRKTAKLYVRQDFEPVFSAPVTIEDRDRPFGTFVFTALQYLPDRSGFVWNVVSVPERPKPKLEPKPEFKPAGKYSLHMRRDDKAAKEVIEPAPPQRPEDVLARIEIPQDAMDQISQMIVPGSSLIISDQGLGDETGEGTDFVVVMH
jgi:lipoprotein-anchoring transpeptidase ErfK/SrfK